MAIGLNYVTNHALDRIRERLPATRNVSKTKILERVAECIKSAERRGELVRAPGGTFVPFDFHGDEAFLVLKKKAVHTALTPDRCPHVVAYLEKKRNGQVRANSGGVPSHATR